MDIWCSCGDAIVPADPGLCGNCASRLRAELEEARNKVVMLAMCLASVSEELEQLSAELKAARAGD